MFYCSPVVPRASLLVRELLEVSDVQDDMFHHCITLNNSTPAARAYDNDTCAEEWLRAEDCMRRQRLVQLF